MNNILKITQKEGIVIFEEFRRAELILIKTKKNTYDLKIIIETYNVDYSEKEIDYLSKEYMNKIIKEIELSYISFEYGDIEFKKIDELNNHALIFDEANESIGRKAGLFVGWNVELNNNQVIFKLLNDKQVHINWTCISLDFLNYEEIDKQTNIVIKADLEIKKFKDKEEYNNYENTMLKDQENYELLLKNLKGVSVNEEEQHIDTSLLAKGNTLLEKSKIAWENKDKLNTLKDLKNKYNEKEVKQKLKFLYKLFKFKR